MIIVVPYCCIKSGLPSGRNGSPTKKRQGVWRAVVAQNVKGTDTSKKGELWFGTPDCWLFWLDLFFSNLRREIHVGYFRVFQGSMKGYMIYMIYRYCCMPLDYRKSKVIQTCQNESEHYCKMHLKPHIRVSYLCVSFRETLSIRCPLDTFLSPSQDSPVFCLQQNGWIEKSININSVVTFFMEMTWCFNPKFPHLLNKKVVKKPQEK